MIMPATRGPTRPALRRRLRRWPRCRATWLPIQLLSRPPGWSLPASSTCLSAATPNATPEKKLSAKEKRRMRERQRQEEACRRKEEMKKTELDCKVCNEDFETRNQLFKHIKQTGHAELKATGPIKKKGKKK